MRDLRPKALEKPPVLIVEDDPGMQDILSTLLNPFYSLTIAGTVANARNELSKPSSFSAILLDLSLPDGNGDDLLKCINVQETPIIVLSAAGTIRRATDLMAKGIFYFLTKDSQPEEILHTVTEAVSAQTQKGTLNPLQTKLDDVSKRVETLGESIRKELWHFRENEMVNRTEGRLPRLKEVISDFEERFLKYALEKNGGRRNKTARALGIHMNTLLLKIRRYGIHRIKDLDEAQIRELD